MATLNNLGNIGNVNFQGLQIAQSIDAHIGELARNKESGDIANALRELTKAITSEAALSDDARKELLEQVELLGSQATTSPEQRKRGLIKPMIDTVAGVCAGAGGLAAVWVTWGPVISKFFGF